ncbi:MAG TPA: hypothetical protein VK358_13175 [Longimicrobium sp.]|nr:hypothetical protein [Longimicrobium sp.]
MPIIHRTNHTLTLALLAALTALTACGDGPAEPGGDLAPATFQLQVSGDTAFSVTGHAGYRAPQMMLTTQTTPQQGDFVQVFVGIPAQPAERRYDVAAQGGGTVFIVRGGTIRRHFALSAGTLDMRHVDGGTVTGSLEAAADELDMQARPTGRVITMRGTFKAAVARL